MNLELYILNTISCLGTRSKSYASRQGTPSSSIIPTPTSNFDNKVLQLNLNTVRTTPPTFCIYFSTIKCTEHQPNPQKPTFIVQLAHAVSRCGWTSSLPVLTSKRRIS